MSKSMKLSNMTLEELSEIKDGWLDGYGKKPTDKALQTLADCDRMLKGMINRVFEVFPDLDGGISLQSFIMPSFKSLGYWDIEITISGDGSIDIYGTEISRKFNKSTKNDIWLKFPFPIDSGKYDDELTLLSGVLDKQDGKLGV